jgi:DNA repair protein RecN (Recombination protein N)
MLVELSVRDLGVIQDLTLTFGPGMTAVTGETGAGKTLIVEAIELLTGGRADPVLVRPGAGEASVEGRFLTGEEERILSRVVPASGRSRAYLDGRMAQAGALSEVAEDLVDLHGQHGHQSLLGPAGQRQALDGFAEVDLAGLRHARRRVRELTESLADLGGDGRVRARELDLLDHQLAEIDRAGLQDPGEDASLAAEEEVLARAGEFRARAEQAYELLSGDGGGAERVGAAVAATAGRSPFTEIHERLAALSAELADAASSLRTAGEALAEDPERLDEIVARRQLLKDLVRKYGSDLGEVMVFADQARHQREELAGHDRAAARLEGELAGAQAAVRTEEERVRAQRHQAAPRLAAQVVEHLRSLALPGAQLGIEVGEDGAGDAVSFLFTANPGSPLLPLSRVASGGELARTMLAVRLVVTAGPPLLVFDEVDAGVGGEAALAVGRSLAALALEHQVLVVTHLAQVAAFADHQVAVRKLVDGDTTRTEVEVLEPEARVVELSRMLAGQPDSTTARQHARELLELARRPG